MNNIAVTISNANECSPLDSIEAIQKAGYKNVFIEWFNKDYKISQEEQLAYCKKLGLNVIFAHLGYQGINNLWLDHEEGEQLVERYINDLKICKENGIDLVCMHLTSKSKAPAFGEVGLNRIKKIVEYGEKIGVRVSFENTKVPGYLEYVMDHIKSDYAGICLDSGHLHAHFKDEIGFEKFKNRIFAVHLHDNHGEEDEHLIPFEGNLDWEKLMDQLKECHYTGMITMELVYRNEYTKMDLVDFYKKGMEAGYKLEEMMK